MRRLLMSSLAISLSLAGAAVAQHDHHRHGKPATAQESEATRGYRAANDRMHKDMAIKYSGNPDIDFVLGMIPHHQGAIDMARVVLAHGKDPKIRKLAQEVIDAQEKEIAMMREWLKSQGQ